MEGLATSVSVHRANVRNAISLSSQNRTPETIQMYNCSCNDKDLRRVEMGQNRARQDIN